MWISLDFLDKINYNFVVRYKYNNKLYYRTSVSTGIGSLSADSVLGVWILILGEIYLFYFFFLTYYTKITMPKRLAIASIM